MHPALHDDHGRSVVVGIFEAQPAEDLREVRVAGAGDLLETRPASVWLILVPALQCRADGVPDLGPLGGQPDPRQQRLDGRLVHPCPEQRADEGQGGVVPGACFERLPYFRNRAEGSGPLDRHGQVVPLDCGRFALLDPSPLLAGGVQAWRQHGLLAVPQQFDQYPAGGRALVGDLRKLALAGDQVDPVRVRLAGSTVAEPCFRKRQCGDGRVECVEVHDREPAHGGPPRQGAEVRRGDVALRVHLRELGPDLVLVLVGVALPAVVQRHLAVVANCDRTAASPVPGQRGLLHGGRFRILRWGPWACCTGFVLLIPVAGVVALFRREGHLAMCHRTPPRPEAVRRRAAHRSHGAGSAAACRT